MSTIQNQIPKHVAIIPDGNRRWAKEHNRGGLEGHKYAVETIIPQLIEKAVEMKISYLTFWLLSTENLVKRRSYEIQGLYFLIKKT